MSLFDVFRFECFYNIKKPHTYLFFALLIFQGIWYSVGTNQNLANKSILLNAPMVVYQILAVMGLILFAVTAIISATGLARDLETGAGQIVYPSMVREKHYFLGKYFAVFLVNLVITVGYPLGILLFPFLGTGAPEQFGPVPLGQLAHGFFLLTLPNLIFLVSFTIFLVVMFKKAAPAYLGVLLLLVFFLVATSVRTESFQPMVSELLDPFAYCSVANIADKMAIAELNSAYLPLTKTLLINRLIWGFVSTVLFIAALMKFNFKTFTARKSPKKVREKNESQSFVRSLKKRAPVMEHGIFFQMKKALFFAWMDWKTLFRSPVFFAIMGVLFFMFIGYNFLWTSTYYLTTSHLPLTSTMTFIRIPMMLVISVLLFILSGEALFKDRTSGSWQILDAMPTPSWVFLLARWLTVCAVAFCICSLILVAGVFSQVCMGFFDIQWGVYVHDLYGVRFGLLTCVFMISLAFFCGSLFNNRLPGHMMSIALFIFIAMSVDFGLIEQLRFAFPFVPAMFGPEKYNYSEMNGYGVLDGGLFWYGGAWAALAGVFFLFTLLVWHRGTDKGVLERFKEVKKRLNSFGGRGLAGIIVFCLCLFFWFQYGIHDRLINQAGYQTKAQKDGDAAAYEKKYGRYRETPQPKITDLDLKLDLFPATRQANYTARLTLENNTGQAMDILHLDWEKKLTIESLLPEGHKLEKREQDQELYHAIYRINPALKPGGRMKLTVVGQLGYYGFHQSDFEGDLTYNGSVLKTDFLPFFGYDRSRELTDNKKRLHQGLKTLISRMATQKNRFSKKNRFGSPLSDNLNWNMHITTSGDQTIVGPGKRIKAWQEGGRNHALFQSQKAGAMDFSILSARFASKSLTCQGLPCTIYHDPHHTYNLAVYQKVLETAIPWLSDALGPYPYTEIKVVEKPFYESDFLTFANVTAISEQRGWTADIKTQEEGQYIYLSLARELARQWIGDSLPVADVQGSELFTQSFASYYSYRFIEEIWGIDTAKKWLDNALKDYEKGRAKEEITEQPLLFVDKAKYLSREKGGLALYAISKKVGTQKFDQWLKSWIEQAKYKSTFLTSMDFYTDLKAFVPEENRPFVRDWFKTSGPIPEMSW